MGLGLVTEKGGQHVRAVEGGRRSGKKDKPYIYLRVLRQETENPVTPEVLYVQNENPTVSSLSLSRTRCPTGTPCRHWDARRQG